MQEKKQSLQTGGRKIPFKAKLALSTACVIWSASFVATKTALPVIPPWTLVALRVLTAAVCFSAWLLVKRVKIPSISGKEWGILFLMSIFGASMHYGIETIGLQYTTASNASLYSATSPVIISILAALFLGERLTWKKALGIGVALAGVLVVQGPETLMQFELKGRLLGDFLVFLSIFMWSIFAVMGKGLTGKLGAPLVVSLATIMGALLLVPIGLYESSSRSFSPASITAEPWIAVLFLGVGCSFLGMFLFFYALQHMESQKVGVYLYTILPMTYIIAAFYLGEPLTLGLLIGSAIVLSGVYVTERG